MSRVRIKICGITRTEDALLAARLGADAVGCNFYSGSPRVVTVRSAALIMNAVPPFVSRVGLFVDPTAAEVREVISGVPLSLLQFHGAESSDFCASFGLPFIQVIRVASGLDWTREAERVKGAAAVLVDSYVEGVPGGTGKTFDWALLPETLTQPVILAGGLNAQNVRDAVRAVRPFAVDVSGGVEVQKGIKDGAKMKAFVEAVGAVEHE